jgi:class 3 adenylate cyclase
VRLLSPAARPRPPWPRRLLLVFPAAFVANGLHALLGTGLLDALAGLTSAAACVAAAMVASRAEHRVYLALGARAVAAGAFPEIGALKVGVGVATGPMICGNVGSERQMEYTVIGDTVNLSARLTGVAKAGEVVVSEATAQALPKEEAQLVAEPLEPVTVKGKEQPVQPYRVREN